MNEGESYIEKSAVFGLYSYAFHVFEQGFKALLLSFEPPLWVLELSQSVCTHIGYSYEYLQKSREVRLRAPIGFVFMVGVADFERIVGMVADDVREEEVEVAGGDYFGVDFELFEEDHDPLEGGVQGRVLVRYDIGHVFSKIHLDSRSATL